ncbi:MAG: transcription termination factor NusA [Anaerolineales bacterium]|nr:transcription termination factor NusA [Anaerolineales bacterium]MDW8277055.1 transcription termination factor NusA [Anaerolineales bacterium]
MKNEFSLAFNEVLEEKQLPKEVILSALESAMVSAYRRAVNASSAQHVEAKIDPDTGKVTVYAEKEVVESVMDERTEVSLEQARKVNPLCQVGDMVIVESTPKDFGRVAAQTARQVIQQRIREAERSAQMKYFERQLGEIVSGVVQATNAQSTTIGLDMKAEGIMPANQRIPGERFRVHDRVRAIIMEIKDGSRGPQIILSRAHRNFLRRLLENEVPEIYHGIVEIRAIAREPGQRAKVAVSATQAGVDPVGACVGVKGVRIQAIVKELHDEKIDIIEWSPDPVVYISKAISPARVSGVYLTEGEKTATVVVMEDQLSLAIGRDGQNARLAAKLTGWRIDIKSVSEAAADALSRLQSEPSMALMAEAEKDNLPLIREILAKKADGRPLTPEEYQALAQFVDRVERRVIERQRAADQESAAKLAEARAGIPAAAFDQPLDVLNLPEHVYNILTEADYRTAGDLLLAMKTAPDRVLSLPGIGPKAMQAIRTAVETVSFPEEEPRPSETVEPVAEASAPMPEPAPEVAVATQPAALDAVVEEEPEAETSFEELFKLRPESFTPASDDEVEKKDKKGKKGKKAFEYEYDEERGEVIGRKKHKRGGDFYEDW